MKRRTIGPKIIVVEGLDGSGKTTISTAISNRLNTLGVNCCHIDYSNGNVGHYIRRQSATIDASTRHLLTAAAFLESYREDVIAPFDVVVADRYVDSVRAYYLALPSAERTIPLVELPELACIAKFLLVCPPAIRQNRIIARDGHISGRKRQTIGRYGTRVFSLLQERGSWDRVLTQQNSIEDNVAMMMNRLALNAPELGMTPA
ncbi:MAG: hypothetical protein HZA88_20590 [Verrucomicrobia bacterium]|nr:hypothetical protein [Verrucomicrobiota bacterium]